MKVCVYGAGAIGGQVAAMLARSGVDVSVVARGPHLAAMREKGLTLQTEEDRFTVRLRCAEDGRDLGPQDYLIVALKAHSVPAIVDRLKPLLGPDTAVVTAANGVPWWYFHKHGGPHDGKRPAAASGRRSGPSAPSAACSGRPPRSSSPARSSSRTATGCRWASRTAVAPSGSRGCRGRCWRRG
jgi:uncharacterized protein YbjT (DUF2867 family)